MLDFYSLCTQHARLVASEHPETASTWPEMVRQKHAAGDDTHLYSGACEKPVLFVRYALAGVALALRSNLRRVVKNGPATHPAGGN